jgi:glycerophosphoryl diester phosphodiesterase
LRRSWRLDIARAEEIEGEETGHIATIAGESDDEGSGRMSTNGGRRALEKRTCRPLVMAHRGNSAYAPENTLAAFEQALDLGADGCECDVHATADGEIVVMHDRTVDRTTDGSGAIGEMTLAEMRALDAGSWKGAEFAGEKVPLLAEVVETHVGRGMLYVEIKDYECTERAIAVIDGCNAQEWASLCSFSYDVCVEARKLRPKLPVALIYASRGNPKPAYELVEMVLAGNLQALSITQADVTADLVVRCRQCGVGLWVWTVDDEERLVELDRIRVGNIVSNDPALALRVCGCG